MTSALVSIIVPVYNVEPYLSDCLESALSQDYGSVEVVVVNDGSTDRSGEILQAYARAHENIVYVESSNQGLSCARNLGMETARGRYVLFLDGDDYLESHAVSTCMETMLRNHAGIVLFSSRPFRDGTGELLPAPTATRHSRLVDVVMSAEEFLHRSLQLRNYIPSACLYLFDRHLVANIRFLPGILHEDNLFTARLFLENPVRRVVAISDALFNRRVRHNSITTMKKTHAHAEGFFQVAEHLQRISAVPGSRGHAARSWLVQFALKEAMFALQMTGSFLSVNARLRAMRTFLRVSPRYWSARFLPIIVMPELLVLRRFVSGWKAGRKVE